MVFIELNDMYVDTQCFRNILGNSNRIAIIHHWDIDGIAASAYLYRALYRYGIDVEFLVPEIGSYSIEAIDISKLKSFNPDLVMVIDYGIKCRDLLELKRVLDRSLVVVDHHRNEVCANIDLFINPVAYGATEIEYPSTCYTLSLIYSNSLFLDLVALSIIGDLSTYVEITKWKSYVESILSIYGYTLRDSYRISRLVDSCYQSIDLECFNYARRDLIEGIDMIFRDGYLAWTRKELDEELYELFNKLRENPEMVLDKVKIFKAYSKNYIVSHLGRKLADYHRDSIVVLKHYVEKLGKSYIYVRSYRYNLSSVIEELRKKGIDVGGKDRVFVITCRDPRCSELDLLLELLSKASY